MATLILPEVGPLPTKDVRRNHDTRDFDAYLIYADGKEVYLGSRKWSWDAESLCDEAYHQELMSRPLVADEHPRELVSCAELEHEAMIGAESVTTYNGVTISTSDGWTTFERGEYFISRRDDDGTMHEPDGQHITITDVADMHAVAAAVLAARTEGECDSCHTFSSSLKNGLCPRCRIATLHTRRDLFDAIIAYAKEAAPEPVVTVTHTHDDENDQHITFTTYTCDGVIIHDDQEYGFEVDGLIDREIYAGGYTDLAGLQRIHTALGAIISRIQQPEPPTSELVGIPIALAEQMAQARQVAIKKAA